MPGPSCAKRPPFGDRYNPQMSLTQLKATKIEQQQQNETIQFQASMNNNVDFYQRR